jgi:hypothetical protein
MNLNSSVGVPLYLLSIKLDAAFCCIQALTQRANYERGFGYFG